MARLGPTFIPDPRTIARKGLILEAVKGGGGSLGGEEVNSYRSKETLIPSGSPKALSQPHISRGSHVMGTAG